MEDNYREMLNTFEDSEVIKYYGLQKDVKPFIKRTHCFVLPSYHEGMANTLPENGAMGRPLITSKIHGCMEAVQDGITGYLCSPRDSEDLYDKLVRFIELPYEEKAKMGCASHEYIAGKFDKRDVVRETMKELAR